MDCHRINKYGSEEKAPVKRGFFWTNGRNRKKLYKITKKPKKRAFDNLEIKYLPIQQEEKNEK